MIQNIGDVDFFQSKLAISIPDIASTRANISQSTLSMKIDVFNQTLRPVYRAGVEFRSV